MKTPDAMKASATPPEDEGVPVSVKIRERIQAARKRFHANDNIA
ncbi:MAG: cyclohydrolase 1, partial [Pseudomonadota bacterium]